MENKMYCEYEVTVESENYDGVVKRRGVICADNFTDAVIDLEQFYGSDIVSIDYLSWGMETLYEFNNPEVHFKQEEQK